MEMLKAPRQGEDLPTKLGIVLGFFSLPAKNRIAAAIIDAWQVRHEGNLQETMQAMLKLVHLWQQQAEGGYGTHGSSYVRLAA